MAAIAPKAPFIQGNRPSDPYGTVVAKEIPESPKHAMTAPSPILPPQNFLFMLPADTTPAEQEVIVNLARRLTAMGYVYIASAHEKTMEDREDIRFMPFHRDLLPSFGEMAGVFVVRDQNIAAAARQAYPNAHVLVIDPDRVRDDLADYEPEVIRSWPTPAATQHLSAAA